MTKKHAHHLLLFITRTPMFTGKENRDCIVSYIYGYEGGTNGKCAFGKLLKKHFENILGNGYGASGWPGQIELFAKREKLDWTEVFKQQGLEIIGKEVWTKEMKKDFRSKVVNMIGRMDEKKWFDEYWIRDWLYLNFSNNDWYKTLWSESEYKSLRAITRLAKRIRRTKVKVLKADIEATLKLKQQFHSEL
ncbi:MAG TPA: hypothetical protein VK174_14650 [Chitinophagales bacterium]|nr:hypothetical protein [Chitinophagales bacterium]